MKLRLRIWYKDGWWYCELPGHNYFETGMGISPASASRQWHRAACELAIRFMIGLAISDRRKQQQDISSSGCSND